MYKIFNSKGCAAIAIAFVIINILVTVVIITSFVDITINQTKQAGKISTNIILTLNLKAT